MTDIFINIYTFWLSKSPVLVIAPSVQFVLLVSILYLVVFKFGKTTGGRNLLLLFFSLYFYYRLAGFGFFILLLIAVTDYITGKKIFSAQSENEKRKYLIISLLVSLGSLFLSKYLILFAPGLSGSEFIKENFLSVIGISYYVFKSISYVVSLYREISDEPEYSFSNYLLYLSFFPSIIAGPISQPDDLLKQFRENSKPDNNTISLAFLLLLTGIAKKVIVADFLAVNFLDKLYESPVYFSSTESIIALIATPLQVYYDFSGYTDIALGTALLFGFSLKDNFNLPFRAVTLTDFWRRWHITLLDWLNLYIFNPVVLGLRNLRKAGLIIAIFITFTISGIWHGAAGVFLLWGIAHAVFISAEVLTTPFRTSTKFAKQKSMVWALFTYLFLTASFVLFKSPDLSTASVILGKSFSGINTGTLFKWLSEYSTTGFILISALLLHYVPVKVFAYLRNQFASAHWFAQAIILAVAFLIVYQFSATEAKPFMYLEF